MDNPIEKKKSRESNRSSKQVIVCSRNSSKKRPTLTWTGRRTGKKSWRPINLHKDKTSHWTSAYCAQGKPKKKTYMVPMMFAVRGQEAFGQSETRQMLPFNVTLPNQSYDHN